MSDNNNNNNNNKEPPARGDIEETAASSSSETSKPSEASSNAPADADLIQQAEDLYANERLFVAANLLKKVQDKSLLKDNHHGILRWAAAAEAGMNALLESPESKESSGYWKKQSEKHGHRDFLVYYHVSKQNELTCRIDSAIESSLLIPILSVFNESELYKTWMPSWERPIKLGIADTKKLKESGRGNQIIQVTVNMAWPFNTRETVQHAMAIDVIDEEGKLAIHVMSETPEEDPVIPEPLPGVVRIDFEANFLIGGCPPDHPCLANSKNNYPEGEELIMITMSSRVDPHVSGVPVKLINLVTRTAFGSLWSALLSVAEEVRDGKRPEHQEAIAAKRELYDFVEGRIDVMIDKVKQKMKLSE
jgi:hypothetical protein